MEEKRAGVVYDDVDLGLDPTIDFADLEEDRLNQLQVREQLDVLERVCSTLINFLRTFLIFLAIEESCSVFAERTEDNRPTKI